MEDLEIERPADAPKPPAVATDFDVDQQFIGPLHNAWSFLVSFGKAIGLSPFSLEDLAQSLESDETDVLVDETHMALLRLIVKHKEETKIKKASITTHGW